jgi:uncharacterized protein
MGSLNDRTCIVTRESGPAEGLIRFAAAPDGTVAPDLKRQLPGRGCWVTATRARVDEAVKKNLFRRGLKEDVTASPDLGALVDGLLVKSALGSLGLARKAGQIVTGSAKVDAAIRGKEAILVLHALDAAPDGVRKIDQARKAVASSGGPDIPSLALFAASQMDLALGGANVIHAAALAGSAGENLKKRIAALARYRGDSAMEEAKPNDGLLEGSALKDTE